MESSDKHGKIFFYIFISFLSGILFTLSIISSRQSQRFLIKSLNSTISSSYLKSVDLNNCSSTNFSIDKNNIDYFYEEFYKYYELNTEWFVYQSEKI